MTQPRPTQDTFADDLPRALLPPGWARPKGYSSGMAGKGRLVVTGGIIGWDQDRQVKDGFVAQARQAFQNIIAILREGGAGPEHIVRLTWYVTDLDAYRACLKELGGVYREIIGPHYPAMAVIGISGLLERQAMVEIEATAIVPE